MYETVSASPGGQAGLFLAGNGSKLMNHVDQMLGVESHLHTVGVERDPLDEQVNDLGLSSVNQLTPCCIQASEGMRHHGVEVLNGSIHSLKRQTSVGKSSGCGLSQSPRRSDHRTRPDRAVGER